MRDSYSIPAYAKLNLCLFVDAPREDGYHPIRAVFQKISLHDTLTVQLKEKSFGFQLSCSDPSLPIDESNTLTRVFRLLEDQLPVGLSVHLEKRIPMGAGLGGGSSNAAALLACLSTLDECYLSKEACHEMAVSIGADVPFFLNSHTAWVTGIGDDIQEIEEGPYTHFVLVYPNQHSHTQSVYQAYDEAAQFPNKFLDLAQLTQNGYLGENHLKAIVFSQIPVLATIEEWVKSQSGPPIYMTGSGSTLFIPFQDRVLAREWECRFAQQYPEYQVFLTASVKG